MGDLDPIPDASADELRKVTLLVRFVALFVAVPTFTIGVAMVLWDPKAHALHMALFLVLAGCAVALMVAAPKVAAHFVKPSA